MNGSSFPRGCCLLMTFPHHLRDRCNGEVATLDVLDTTLSFLVTYPETNVQINGLEQSQNNLEVLSGGKMANSSHI